MNRTETAALMAKHGVENEALLTELAGPPDVDWEEYRDALNAEYGNNTDCATPFDWVDIDRVKSMIAAHPLMPETKAMQARIDAMELSIAAQVRDMAERFLAWKLPADFNPDAGISFGPEFNVDYMEAQGKPPMRHEPTGTNLFNYTQAEGMVRHMLRVLP